LPIDEENGESSADSDRSPDKRNGHDEDSGSDSDPMEGELNNKELAALHQNIKITIDQFENYFNTGVLKKIKKGNSLLKK
jgi:hypothetical protein